MLVILRPPANITGDVLLPWDTEETPALADVGLGIIGDIVQIFCLVILVIIGYFIAYRVFRMLQHHCYDVAREEFERPAN
ncbi:hypothetical protein NPIL_178941 [Nephila pilipes]|uniref:Uncharacterized protein n=1 Tax=Nephila pilipes TaxID=299642 RepID=A0A8X6NCQ2_NEPPI|nr:hypothetical protein NPIL_178941 [Nephila pilipes]